MLGVQSNRLGRKVPWNGESDRCHCALPLKCFSLSEFWFSYVSHVSPSSHMCPHPLLHVSPTPVLPVLTDQPLLLAELAHSLSPGRQKAALLLPGGSLVFMSPICRPALLTGTARSSCGLAATPLAGTTWTETAISPGRGKPLLSLAGHLWCVDYLRIIFLAVEQTRREMAFAGD